MARNSYNELKGSFSGDQNFMTGHQIMKVRSPNRKVPKWVFDDAKIKIVLLKAFPKLASDPTQRRRAGRWAQVIQIYFRAKKSYRETAEEIGETSGSVHNIINRIRRVSIGKPANNVKRKRDLIRTKGGGVDKGPDREPQSQPTL